MANAVLFISRIFVMGTKPKEIRVRSHCRNGRPVPVQGGGCCSRGPSAAVTGAPRLHLRVPTLSPSLGCRGEPGLVYPGGKREESKVRRRKQEQRKKKEEGTRSGKGGDKVGGAREEQGAGQRAEALSPRHGRCRSTLNTLTAMCLQRCGGGAGPVDCRR